MDKKSVPFWEEAYQSENITAFSSKPNATIKEFEHLLSRESRIIDVGCGEGQNALYFARNGYSHVDAFDISENGIARLRQRCRSEDIPLNAFIADLTTYQFEGQYDMVMSFGTLHFVYKTNWKDFISRAKAHTNSGGIHIMQIFTDTVPASEDIAPFAVGLAKEGEIKELYSDWEILQYKSYTFEDEHPGVPKHLHASNKIAARKKR
jgi:cyclopropane fatty-acyl-phospholipid synthase-like methyltransferase